MTDNIENLVLKILKSLRNEVKSQGIKIDEQFESVRLRLGSMENHLAGLQHGVAGIHADIAVVHGRMDKFETHLDRIERRLELRDDVVERDSQPYPALSPRINTIFLSTRAGC